MPLVLEDDCLNVLLQLPLTSSPPSRCDSEISGSCDQCGETLKTGRTLSVHGEKSFKMGKTLVEIMAVMEVIMRRRVDMVVEMVAIMIMNFAPAWRSMISTICLFLYSRKSIGQFKKHRRRFKKH